MYVDVRDSSCQTDAWLYPDEEPLPQEQGHEDQEQTRQVQIRIDNLKLLKIRELKKNNMTENEKLNKLRLQQDKLKKELKDMNDLLTQTVDRQKQQRNKEKPYDPAVEEQTLNRELTTITKHIDQLDKENDRLAKQLSEKYNTENLLELETQFKDLQETVEGLQRSTRQLNIELKDKERKLQNPKRQNQQEKKINFLMDEVSGLKKLVQQNQQTQRWNEKNLKHQEEFIVVMQQKYQEVCDQFDMEPGLNFKEYLAEQDHQEGIRDLDRKHRKVRDNSTIQNANSSYQQSTQQPRESRPSFFSRSDLRSIQSKVKKDIEENFEVIEEMEVCDETIKFLVDKLNIWKKNRKTMEHQCTTEITQLKYRIQLAEEQINKQVQQLKEKEKEIEISKMRITEQSKGVRHSVLPPLAIGSIDIKDAIKIEKQYRSTGKSASAKPSSQAISFDDSTQLPKSKLYRLQAIIIYWKGSSILGMSSKYFLKENEKEQIIHNNPNFKDIAPDDYKLERYDFRENEYITSVFGIVTTRVEFLKFTTNRGFTFEVGDPANFKKDKAQNVQFEIQKNEKPIAIQGLFDKMEGAFSLISLSLLTKKKISLIAPLHPPPKPHKVVFSTHKTPQSLPKHYTDIKNLNRTPSQPARSSIK